MLTFGLVVLIALNGFLYNNTFNN